MLPNAIELFKTAITNNRRIALHYKGQRHVRVVEPHVLYRMGSGRIMVECYQLRGYSTGGRVPPFWRPFQVARITALELLDELFEVRTVEGYETLCKLLRGEILARAPDASSRYTYLNTGICGPPKPSIEATWRMRSLG